MAIDFVNALVGLGGVVVGSLLTLWGQGRQRQAEMRNEIRRAYGDWFGGRLTMRRWEGRVVDTITSMEQLAAHRPSPLARGTDRLAEDQWQATMQNLEGGLEPSLRQMEHATAEVEAAYARIMLVDQDERRLAFLASIQDAAGPYAEAQEAAEQQGGSNKFDREVYDRGVARVAAESGKLARYVELSLRVEGMAAWARMMKESSGKLPPESVRDEWNNWKVKEHE